MGRTINREDVMSFGFDIDKIKINCTKYAIDLPNNEFGINVFIDVLGGSNGIVTQNDTIIGSCSMVSPNIRKMYSTVKYIVQLNISQIDWTDAESSLFFKLGANSVYQIPTDKNVGEIISADTKILSDVEKDEMDRGFRFAQTIVAGKQLENRAELFGRIKMLVYSKFV